MVKSTYVLSVMPEPGRGGVRPGGPLPPAQLTLFQLGKDRLSPPITTAQIFSPSNITESLKKPRILRPFPFIDV